MSGRFDKGREMQKQFTKILLTVILVILALPAVTMGARIKDIAKLKGVRNNQLIGYGLIVGLNGTGDSSSTEFTIQSLVNMLERLGVTVDKDKVKVDNVAAVMVTAELLPFAKPGNTIDVLVSSIGDADNLSGGSLLMTPLKGPDGNVYAVAQGSITTGALAFSGEAASAQKNHPTVGRIPDGGLVEREVPFIMEQKNMLTYELGQADFTTVSRMAGVINSHYAQHLATAVDSGGLTIQVPEQFQGKIIDFIASLESLTVTPDTSAKIVVNERTGTIVMGEEVRISTVAVSHANLSIIISETATVSQPNAFARRGRTEVVPETAIDVVEDQANLVVMEMGVSIGDVANALNAITPSAPRRATWLQFSRQSRQPAPCMPNWWCCNEAECRSQTDPLADG
jgi:flagellar P-ring protein precursor FlgI